MTGDHVLERISDRELATSDRLIEGLSAEEVAEWVVGHGQCPKQLCTVLDWDGFEAAYSCEHCWDRRVAIESRRPPCDHGWTIPEGYSFTNVGECRACHALMAWCLTKANKKAPLNPTAPRTSPRARRLTGSGGRGDDSIRSSVAASAAPPVASTTRPATHAEILVNRGVEGPHAVLALCLDRLPCAFVVQFGRQGPRPAPSTR